MGLKQFCDRCQAKAPTAEYADGKQFCDGCAAHLGLEKPKVAEPKPKVDEANEDGN